MTDRSLLNFMHDSTVDEPIPGASAPETAAAAPRRSQVMSLLVEPRLLLRAEAAIAFAAASLAYWHMGGGWLTYLGLFFLPDVAIAFYLAGSRIGAAAYNLAHHYAPPAALAAWGLWSGQPDATLVALVWIAHIGFDRLFGYGLKLETGFKTTHLGRI